MAAGAPPSLLEPRSWPPSLAPSKPSSPSIQQVSREAVGHVAIAALMMVVVGCGPPSPVELPIVGVVPDFTLVERSGRQVRAADLKGHVWVANFIFTRCPSICPGLSARMAVLQNRLRTDGAGQAEASEAAGPSGTHGSNGGDEVRLVSFTVDPEYDTAEVLRLYADRFRADPDRWLFLTGPRAAIHQLVREGFRLGIDEQPSEEAREASGPIIHSDRFVLVDRGLRIRGYYSVTEEEELAELIQHVAVLSQEDPASLHKSEGT